MNLQNIAIGKSQIIGFRAKINSTTYDDISLYKNLRAYVKIGSTVYDYDRYLGDFYSTSQYLDKILVDTDKTILAKEGEKLSVTWLVKVDDPLNIGEFLYEPVLEQIVGIFKKTIVEIP